MCLRLWILRRAPLSTREQPYLWHPRGSRGIHDDSQIGGRGQVGRHWLLSPPPLQISQGHHHQALLLLHRRNPPSPGLLFVHNHHALELPQLPTFFQDLVLLPQVTDNCGHLRLNTWEETRQDMRAAISPPNAQCAPNALENASCSPSDCLQGLGASCLLGEGSKGSPRSKHAQGPHPQEMRTQ